MNTKTTKRASIDDLFAELKKAGHLKLLTLLTNTIESHCNDNDFEQVQVLDREEVLDWLTCELDNEVNENDQTTTWEDLEKQAGELIDTQLLAVCPDFFSIEFDLW